MKQSKYIRKIPLKQFIYYCSICKKLTYHRSVFQEFVACDDCDFVQHKPLKKLLETKDNCECPGCHQDLSSCICDEAT